MKKYTFDVLSVKDFSVIETEKKCFYNLDGKKNYLDEIKMNSVFKGNKIDFPNMYGSLNFRENGSGVFYDDSIGFLVCEGDTVEGNPSSVFFLSGPSYRNRGININESNFLMITSYFSSRVSIDTNWINQKDSYIFNPNQFVDNMLADTIIFSLFNNSSFQCSARNVNFKNQNYNVKNHFFWISNQDMKELADESNFDEMYNDARMDTDRFTFKILYEKGFITQLSDLAKQILDQATNLVKISMEIRLHCATTNNQLNCWDAGYSQLKSLWKEYFPQEYKTFRENYKELEKKMIQRTFELGFLQKN